MSAILVFGLRVLMLICLYGFLAWAMLTIWRDLYAQTAILQSRKAPALTMSITNMLDDMAATLSVPEIIIGRSPACTYVIPNETVSSSHARLSYHHDQWWAEDLRSTNGSFLNDEPIQTPTVIISGDDLRCGQVIIHLQIEDPNLHA